MPTGSSNNKQQADSNRNTLSPEDGDSFPASATTPAASTLKSSRSLSLIIGEHNQQAEECDKIIGKDHQQQLQRLQFQQLQQDASKYYINNDCQILTSNSNNRNNSNNNNNNNNNSFFFTASQLDSAGANKLRPTNKYGHYLHSQYSMPCSLDNSSRRATLNQNATYQLGHSLLDERIIFCQLSIVSKKDFAEEVRALLDVRKFVSDSFILTDVCEVRIDAIVETIIERLVECRQLGHSVAEEAKSLLCVERESLSMVLANTMQGLYKSRSDGRLAYDHSWIVATCSLSGLSKRQVAITRFAQPVNFGRQSQEVRFLIIVLAPSKEKLTKSAWETGRTFATMFTDIEFRRRLLKAKNVDEIKVELLVRAETLAREHELRLAMSSDNSESSEEEDDYENYNDDDDNLDLSSYNNNNNNNNNGNKVAAICYASATSGASSSNNSDKVLVASSRVFRKSLANFEQQQQQQRNNSNSSATSSACASVASSARKEPRRTRNSKEAGPRRRAPHRKLRNLAAQDQRENRNGCKRAKTDKDNAAADADATNSPLGCCGGGGGGKLTGQLGSGLLDDLKRRSRWYLSDFTDGLIGERSLYKTISTTIFLYFSVLLPCIAFGVVDTNNTDGHIDPKKTMIGQALGGLFFALFSGQPLVVVMTTAPLCIYVKVIYLIAQDLEVDFGSFYALVGLWMGFFLVIMSLTNSSNFMKHCTRSTEDIFAIFTAFAFGSDGVREAIRSFQKYYWEADCGLHQTQHVLVSRALLESADSIAVATSSSSNLSTIVAPSNLTTTPAAAAAASVKHHDVAPYATSSAHATILSAHQDGHLAAGGGNGTSGLIDPSGAENAFALASQSIIRCQRETCILFLFLMCGTLWLANSFNSFDRTPYLSSRKREIIKDYALAISVLIFSFIGSYLFAEVRLDVFEFSEFTGLHFARFTQLSLLPIATACLLGFMASVLFYIDQNICGAMVNNAPYKLKKGNYFHLDLLILAILNTFLSLTGLPWMHGKLPHSHLHSKALADYEERVDEGHIHQMIVNIRETRMTGILVSILVALSLLAVPYPLSYIPLPVLSGVFLYTALAEFKSNSMVERICLLFTEQVAYPPNHYIRRCPQRKIHLFTLAQIVQLAIVSFIGFYPNPYVNMAFPLAVATFVPVRELLLPKLIDIKYLHSLDSPSLE